MRVLRGCGLAAIACLILAFSALAQERTIKDLQLRCSPWLEDAMSTNRGDRIDQWSEVPTSLSLDIFDLAEWILDIKWPIDLASALLYPTQRLGPVADFRLPLVDR